ncbi:hypothetical protein ABT030_03025 [Streptomyces mirabilis]|uniref:hypothetical protein n=1 Tax=Streptomyces mirabilis TaxID=68239 RepID=UPI00333128EA
MAPDPQVLEQLYTEKAQLAPGRAAALAGLTYAETVLDIYGGTSANLTDSASTHLSRALASLNYLDQVRQRSSYTEAANDPRYLADNSREQASQLTVLAQTDIAIGKATAFHHTDTVNILEGYKNSFETYSTQVAEICAREQDEDSPYASSTASPANPEAHPTQPPPTAGRAYPTAPGAPAGAVAAAKPARSYELTNQESMKNPSRIRSGEKDAAWEWAENHLDMDRKSYGNKPPDGTVVNLFREERGETPHEVPSSKNPPSNSAQRYRNLTQRYIAQGANLDAKPKPQEETDGLRRARMGDYSQATFTEWRTAKFPEWTPESSRQDLRLMNYPGTNAEAMAEYRRDRDASQTLQAGPMASAPQIPQYPQNPVGPYASQASPPQGNRQGTAQAGPAAQPPPARNPYQNPHGPHGPAR